MSDENLIDGGRSDQHDGKGLYALPGGREQQEAEFNKLIREDFAGRLDDLKSRVLSGEFDGGFVGVLWCRTNPPVGTTPHPDDIGVEGVGSTSHAELIGILETVRSWLLHAPYAPAASSEP